MAMFTTPSAAEDSGDSHDSQELLPLLYDKLRRLAARKLSQERPGQTLDATGLVHEAYLRLVAGNGNAHWDSRGHFFQAAAEAMRRILINRARDKQCLKRGGGFARVSLDNLDVVDDASYDDLLALEAALDRLAQENRPCADLVTLRFFGGLSQAEAAATLDISRRTADRHWAFARAWLYEALSEPDEAAHSISSRRAR